MENKFLKPKNIELRKQELQKEIEEKEKEICQKYFSFYDKLPDPYKIQAKNNFVKGIKCDVDVISNTLLHGFTWDKTPEGYNYWEDIFNYYAYKEKSNSFNKFLENEKLKILSFEREEDCSETHEIVTEREIDMAFNFLKNHCSTDDCLKINLIPNEVIQFAWFYESSLLSKRKRLNIHCSSNHFEYIGQNTFNLAKIKGIGTYNELYPEIKEFIGETFSITK